MLRFAREKEFCRPVRRRILAVPHVFDDTFKERVREATDIVELVQQYRPVTRSGRNYKALCPFHDDSRPSLHIDPQRQYYKCFVCQEGGDVFSFVMKMENSDFREALTSLAERAGIALPKKREKKFVSDVPIDENAEEQPQEDDKKTLLKAVEWLTEKYHQALETLDEAKVARKYLEERKIGKESIEKFLIGYAPMERDWLARKVNFDTKKLRILELVGNLRKSEHGDGYYDFFRGRLLFPIRDDQGRPIAFGGRVIPGTPLADKDVGKYMNTGKTPLYVKNRVLFGFDVAKRKMRTTKRALIMEGYTDVIAAHQFGFEEAVAACGTAVGPEHIRKLKLNADKILLVLDGDKAGTTGATRVLGDFIAEGADVAVVTLPEGRDPAEFLEQKGAEGFQTVLDTGAVDALEHAFRAGTRGIDLDHDVIAASNALDELLTTIAKAPFNERKLDDPRIRIEKTLQILSERFRIPEDTVRRRFNAKRKQAKEYRYGNNDTGEYESAAIDVQRFRENLPDLLEREMLELWLRDPMSLYFFWEAVPPERCRSPITRQIYEKCNELIARDIPATFDRLLVAFDDPMMKAFLVELLESGLRKSAVHTPVVAETDVEKTPSVLDEVGELEESLRSRENEQELLEENREKFVKEILAGFDQRDRERRRIKDVSQLRRDAVTEDGVNKLLQMQADQRQRQEEKKRKQGLE